MLRLVTGPFHPTLESSLVRDLRLLKQRDPRAAIALVVPSDQLRRSLKRLLVLTHRLPLLNVHVLSFHQLALHLDRERQTNAVGRSSSSLELVGDIFFERLLEQLGQRDVPHTEALRLDRLPPGAWPALWASLRDLKDAAVDPPVAVRAVEDGLFPSEDGEKLKGLFALQAAVREAGRALGVGLPDDLAAAMSEVVQDSSFLRGLTRISYYGFYDLTQTQLTLLERLAAAYEVTVYFPLGSTPSYDFARQFLERHLYPLAGAEVGEQTELPMAVSVIQEKSQVSVEVRNAAGVEDEVALVCKQILDLIETHNYRFDEIGVVGRTLAPYQVALARAFDRHRIPYQTSATVPLLREPLVKTLLHLAELKANGLHRPSMLDVLTSPWNRALAALAHRADPRPDLWRLALEALGIVRGEEEWQRLAQLGGVVRYGRGEGDEGDRDELGSLAIDRPQLQLLWTHVAALIDDVKQLPAEGGYGEVTDAYLALAMKHLLLPDNVSPDAVLSEDIDQADVGEALSRLIAQLRSLDRLGVTVSWREWVEVLAQMLDRTTSAQADAAESGVQILDAMAARGVGFRALFVIGLNEELFPRYIHEDGFLRDHHRQVLNETLGYKIDQKLQGYGEEALLFELLRDSAQERLYLSYQRADATGRPLTPSSYLETAGLQPHGVGLTVDLALPRRWSKRGGQALFTPALLTQEELTVNALLRGQDASSLLEATGREAALFSRGLAAQGILERYQTGLHGHDGMLDDPVQLWAKGSRAGFSPTALETYARCPFQYFASRVLGVESRQAGSSGELEPAALGQLCHDALRLCYQAFIGEGQPIGDLAQQRIAEVVERSVGQAFQTYASTHGTGYALIWQLAQEQVTRVVLATLEADHEAARESGFQPIDCEVEAKGTLPINEGVEPTLVKGRWDRVDRHPESGALRVIDYKYRANNRVEAKDRNLLQASLRAARLQPALYSLMGAASSTEEPSGSKPEQVDFLYLLPEGSPPVERVSFPTSAWKGAAGQALTGTLRVILTGIREGRFHILPDAYCSYCEFAAACRRSHQPTWWRAYRSAEAGGLRSLRTLKVPRE